MNFEIILSISEKKFHWNVMKIKTTVRYHLTPVRMGIMKKTKTTYVGKDVKKL